MTSASEGGADSSEKSQGDPKNTNSVVLNPNPTISELEWLLGAPTGFLTTEADSIGRTTVTLGPRLTPSASGSREAALLPGLREALLWKPNTPQLENAMTYAWESAIKSFIRALEKNESASVPIAEGEITPAMQRAGMDVHQGVNGSPLCTVSVMEIYKAMRAASTGTPK